jgi:hypothetical protein
MNAHYLKLARLDAARLSQSRRNAWTAMEAAELAGTVEIESGEVLIAAGEVG